MNRNNAALMEMIAEHIHTGDPLLRAEVESRVLADQPQAGIAYFIDLPLRAIAAYEARFWRVREFLLDKERVWQEFLGGQPDGLIDPYDVGRFWRIAAYTQGISLLHPLLIVVDHDKLKEQGIVAYLDSEVDLPREHKMLVAQSCCPLLKTSDGVDLVLDLSGQRNWKKKLPAGENPDGIFGKMVSLIRSARQSQARQINRLMRSGSAISHPLLVR